VRTLGRTNARKAVVMAGTGCNHSPVDSTEVAKETYATVLGRRKLLISLAFAAAGTLAIDLPDAALATEEDANQLVDDFAKLTARAQQDPGPTSGEIGEDRDRVSTVQQLRATSYRELDGPEGGVDMNVDREVDTTAQSVDLKSVFAEAARVAIAGAKAGALASAIQTITLTWLYTTMFYQYKYGGDLGSALKTLVKDSDGTFRGRVSRLYAGFPFALFEAPVVKLGDTFANVGILMLLDGLPAAAGIPEPIKTAAAAVTGGLWRALCQPIDTAKTTLQVEGQEGFEKLKEKVSQDGFATLFRGAFAAGTYTVASEYPFFLTYNALDKALPLVSQDDVQSYLMRAALIGISSQCVANTLTNPLLIVKTLQQTAGTEAADQGTQTAAQGTQASAEDSSGGQLTAAEALAVLIEAEGSKGLFRGIDTRLLLSSIQGAVFGALLKFFETY